MKISKKRWGDIAWIVAFLIILFTPLGKEIKIQINRLMAFSPSVTEQDESVHLTTFQWTLQSLETREVVNLNDFKGQVIFMNTWATWCPPCIAEMPEIEQLYADYKDKVKFLMLTTDKQKGIDSFMNKQGYTFKNYRPVSETPKAIESSSIPYTVVIDKQGYIRVDKVGAAKWNHTDFREALDRMLEE